jgi:DNA recombination protein RmuC
MEVILYLTLAVVVIGFAVIFWFLRSGKLSKGDQSLVMLQNQINELNRTLDSKLGESAKVMREQSGQNTKIVEQVVRELTKVGEGQKQVADVATQLQRLQDVLKNTKQRGMLGEYSLQLILDNYFPHNYESQYEFKDGKKVDFVLKVKDKLIPIDSKFSLDNYQRLLETNNEEERLKFESSFKDDLKARIDETAQYIKPEEGTLDFAFMFIPAEAVYYDLLVNKIGAVKSNTKDLIQYAMSEKKVAIVSPSSFLAYLQTILEGLRAMQIEESTKQIIKRVEDLRRHINSYDEYMDRLGKNLGTTVKAYDRAYKELGKVDKDVLRITGEAAGIEPLSIESPAKEHEE